MVTRNEAFPSRFTKASDLGGKPRIVEIDQAVQQELGMGEDKNTKTVIFFTDGITKPLVLNMVNWDSVAAIAGDNTDDWPGHRIEIYPGKTPLKGSIVDCIRIRPPRQKTKPKASQSVDADMDDEIPF